MKLLEGLRVVAVEQYGAGPFGTLQLAQLGADVIKIENLREGGDVSRHVRRSNETLPEGDSLFYQTFNLGKRSMGLDLKSEKGREIFHKLAANADAVFNNLRGDTQDKLGLTYEALSTLNPRIVCVHVTAYGRRGSRARWPGYDYLMQSEAGFLSVTGEPDGPPTRMGLSIVDQAAGVQAALALMSGVYAARRTGIGCDLDVSLFSTAISHLTYLATWYLNTGHVQGRAPRSSHPTLTPSQLYRTQDGWLFIMANKEKFWPILVKALGSPPELQRQDFANFEVRLANRNELTKILDNLFMQKPTRYWIDRFSGSLPVAPVFDIAQALSNPFAHELNRIAPVEHDHMPLNVVAPATEVNGQPIRQTRAPEYGEHTDALLEELGYGESERAGLRGQGIVK
jgi:succinate---hydroxymethylglutarate CoA-transferase